MSLTWNPNELEHTFKVAFDFTRTGGGATLDTPYVFWSTVTLDPNTDGIAELIMKAAADIIAVGLDFPLAQISLDVPIKIRIFREHKK